MGLCMLVCQSSYKAVKKKKKGSVRRQFWHSSPGKWQPARVYWGRAKTIWRIPNAGVGYSSLFALVSLFILCACSLSALCQVEADNFAKQNWRRGQICCGVSVLVIKYQLNERQLKSDLREFNWYVPQVFVRLGDACSVRIYLLGLLLW